MTDVEARAFVAESMRGVMAETHPLADPAALRTAARQLVDAIINNYLAARLVGTEPKGRAS
jgi:hypothetical protein